MKKGITLWLLTILLVMGIVSGCSDVSQTSANASNSAAGDCGCYELRRCRNSCDRDGRY